MVGRFYATGCCIRGEVAKLLILKRLDGVLGNIGGLVFLVLNRLEVRRDIFCVPVALLIRDLVWECRYGYYFLAGTIFDICR